MSKDSAHTHLHRPSARLADLLEDFCKTPLPAEDVHVAPQHQPPNPEDEDDVVPDQHAAFGIQRATQARREPAWRDLGLEELMRRGPPPGGAGAAAAAARGSGRGSGTGGAMGGMGVRAEELRNLR